MPDSHGNPEKPSTTLPGTVQKIIKTPNPQKPEQAEIVVENAEELYQEIRVDNTLVNEQGEEVGLKPGAPVEVTIQADEKDVIKRKRAGEPENPVPNLRIVVGDGLCNRLPLICNFSP